jgi:ZIP family zinc transporter
MLYVSFVEIFQKAVLAFQKEHPYETAYLYATLCFFGGVLVMKAIDFIVHKMLGGSAHPGPPDLQTLDHHLQASNSVSVVSVNLNLNGGNLDDSCEMLRGEETGTEVGCHHHC